VSEAACARYYATGGSLPDNSQSPKAVSAEDKEAVPKKTLVGRAVHTTKKAVAFIKEGIHHYWLGSKLLALNVRTAFNIAVRLKNGHTLTVRRLLSERLCAVCVCGRGRVCANNERNCCTILFDHAATREATHDQDDGRPVPAGPLCGVRDRALHGVFAADRPQDFPQHAALDLPGKLAPGARPAHFLRSLP